MLDGHEVDTLFPFGDFEDLLINWPVSYMLNQNKYTASVMQRMVEDDAGAIKFKRLYDLIKQNYSYQVFEAIKALRLSCQCMILRYWIFLKLILK